MSESSPTKPMLCHRASATTSQRQHHPYRSTSQASRRSQTSIEELSEDAESTQPSKLPGKLDVRSPRRQKKKGPVFGSATLNEIAKAFGSDMSFLDSTMSGVMDEGQPRNLLPAFEVTSVKPRARQPSFNLETRFRRPSFASKLSSRPSSVIDLSCSDVEASPNDSPTATPSPTKSQSSILLASDCLLTSSTRKRSASSSDLGEPSLRPAKIPTRHSYNDRASFLARDTPSGSPVPSPPSSPTKQSPVSSRRSVKSLSSLRERQQERRQLFRRTVSALDRRPRASDTPLGRFNDDEDEDLEASVSSMAASESATNPVISELGARLKSPKTPQLQKQDASGGSLSAIAARLPTMKRHSFINVTSPNDSPIAMFLLAGFTVPSEEDDGFFRSSMGITDENPLDEGLQPDYDQENEPDVSVDSDDSVPFDALKENVPLSLTIPQEDEECEDSQDEDSENNPSGSSKETSSLAVRGRMRSASIVSIGGVEGEGVVSPSVLQDITHLMI